MKPGESTQDQSEAIAFLADPATHDGAPVERIDTHAAMVFLAGDRAYKLKRAIWFPFLDFSTLEKRRAACEAEVRLNRRTAPDIYLGFQPITRAADGSIAIDGAGDILDWIVVMKRFGQDLLFDGMAGRGELTDTHIVELADEIAEFHEAAERRPDKGGSNAIRWIVDDDIAELAALPETFGAAAVEALRHLSVEALRRCETLLDERRAAGFVRHCHGDLHLRNIFLWHGQPTLFDCLEFDENLSCTDVLYDLAFLLMDLEHRGLRGFANLAFNRYLQRTGDLGGLPALPLFMSCRAAIRAKVEASGAAHQPDPVKAKSLCASAREYLLLASGLLTPHAPQLIGIGGESGSGKSTVAALLSQRLGEAPGALIIRSDVTRKRLFGYRLEEPLPEEGYAAAATERTFGQMIEDARAGLAAGMTVIADAVYAEPAEREALEAAAHEAGVPFHGFWLDVPLKQRVERVSGRKADASDASTRFLREHPRREKGEMRWRRIDASGDATEIVLTLFEALQGAMAPA